MERPSEQNAASARRRQALKTALYLTCLVVAVLAAWLLHRAIRSRRASRGGGASRLAVAPRPRSGPAWTPGAPARGAEIVAAPLQALGLASLAGHPGGLEPPAGAERLYGFRRALSDQVEQLGRYEYAGSPDAAARHYVATLAGEGYRLLKDSTGPDGRRVLVFLRDAGHATIALRTDPAGGKIVTIVATVVTPTPSDQQGER
jgi:hypothetical protein